MTCRIHLLSLLLVWSATCTLASQPNASIVVSDHAEYDPIIDKVPGLTVSIHEPCTSCGAVGTCRASCSACVGRLLGFGCENGCCGNTCNMHQHLMYYPADHGYYYFLPYNHRHVLQQKIAVMRYGGDPRNPYDNRIFQDIYEGLETVQVHLRDTHPTPPQPVQPAQPQLPPVQEAPEPVERQLDPPAETPEASPPTPDQPAAHLPIAPREQTSDEFRIPVVQPISEKPVLSVLMMPSTVELAPEIVFNELDPVWQPDGTHLPPETATFEGITVQFDAP